jgi:hypothetical protein
MIAAIHGRLEQSFMKRTITAITANKSRIIAGSIMNIKDMRGTMISLLLDNVLDLISFVCCGQATPAL